MDKFNRSSFLKQRHKRARTQRKLFSDLTGDNKPYSEFLSNQTPLGDEITVYEVSYQMSYTSSSNGLNLQSPSTFIVYAVKGKEVQDNIVKSTAEAVSNMTGSSGVGFNPQMKTIIENDLNNGGVSIKKVNYPRGMEQINLNSVDDEVIRNLKTGQGIYTKNLDDNVQVGNKSKNKYPFKVNLDRYIN